MFETPSQHLTWSADTLIKKLARFGPMILLPATFSTGWIIGTPETHTFYLGCIMWWITPVMLFLWTLAGDHACSRWRSALLTTTLPTAYLCIVDTVALRAGTWHITERTSTGIFVWKDLPLEEFTFFLVTNALLVCGMSTFERAFAVIDVYGDLLVKSANARPEACRLRDLRGLEIAKFFGRSLTLRTSYLPESSVARIPAFEETQQVLAIHSRSFHTASYVFPSAVRRDLVILYAFCRVLDDFADESASMEDAQGLIDMSKEYLDLLYPPEKSGSVHPSEYAISLFLHKRVPRDAQSAFFLLSTISSRVPRYPFDDLIEGYEWDLAGKPIVTETDLVEYSRRVASSVAEMCVWAMWANEGGMPEEQERKRILEKAASMGVALQITNIARDIREDSTKGRIYLPQDWFKGGGDSDRQQDYNSLVLAAKEHRAPSFPEFRYHIYLRQLLDLAEVHRRGTSEAIRQLPRSCQAGIRAATGVYIAIGSKIRQQAFATDGSSNPLYEGHRVSMTKWQRIQVAIQEVYMKF